MLPSTISHGINLPMFYISVSTHEYTIEACTVVFLETHSAETINNMQYFFLDKINSQV